jgi:hypothetical protein
LAARDLGHGVHEVTLLAIPTAAVSGVELELRPSAAALPLTPGRGSFGATPSGMPRAWTWRVRLASSGADLVGSVRVKMPSGQWRAAPASTRLGAPTAPPVPRPVREIVLPTGERVAEIR